MFVLRSKYLAMVESFERRLGDQWRLHLQEVRDLGDSLRAENNRLRRDNVEQRNLIQALRGKLTAEAHANGQPAPAGDIWRLS